MEKQKEWQEATVEERPTDIARKASTAREGVVRPSVQELIRRNIEKHADTWAELAKH